VTISLASGLANVVGPTGFDRVGSIEFDADGKLYGGLSQNASSYANWLVEIDTSSGAASLLFDTGYSITGLTSSAPVPEPGTILLLSTGVLGLAGLRRRKSKKR